MEEEKGDKEKGWNQWKKKAKGGNTSVQKCKGSLKVKEANQIGEGFALCVSLQQ